MNTIRFQLSGDCMMMQNIQTANPRNKYAKLLKQLTADKKRKGADVDAILDEIADTEVEACLYYNEELGVHLPAANIRAALIDGAKLSKLGRDIDRYCAVGGDAKLVYPGPQTVQGIVEDPEHRYDALVKVGMSTVPKSRAIFRDWSCEVEIHYMAGNKMDARLIKKCMTDAGLFCGIGASRRLGFGRFHCQEIDENGRVINEDQAAAK